MKTCIKCGFDADAPIDANTDSTVDANTDATIAEIEKKIKEQNLISEIISSAEESSSNWSKNIEHLNTGT